MLTRLTNKLHNTLYTFSRPRKSPANYLPLYQSSVFKCMFLSTQLRISMMSSRKANLPSDTSNFYLFFSQAYDCSYDSKLVFGHKDTFTLHLDLILKMKF